jgi:16S rRNA G527 N7-methylase RsmG
MDYEQYKYLASTRVENVGSRFGVLSNDNVVLRTFDTLKEAVDYCAELRNEAA